jgi:hypothetical protein
VNRESHLTASPTSTNTPSPRPSNIWPRQALRFTDIQRLNEDTTVNKQVIFLIVEMLRFPFRIE